MSSPAPRAPAPGFTFGWRSTSKVIYQVEPFTEPRHAEVLAELHRIPAPMMEVGGHQRWIVERIPAQGGNKARTKMRALDPETGLSPAFLARMRELGDKGYASMTDIIIQLAAVAADEVAVDVLSLMVSQMIADVTRHRRVPKPEGWLPPFSVQFGFDRGTAIFLPTGAMPFTGEETEQEENGDRVIRFRRRVAPGLSSLTATRNEAAARVDIAIPGVPRTHPLAGWTWIEKATENAFVNTIRISAVA